MNGTSVSGRRIKKNVVGKYIVKYVYDGDHVIAEYDDSGLLRKMLNGIRAAGCNQSCNAYANAV